ncbi:MAG: class III signal peptide-containing protein [Atopobiaceae bacterium]|jgi:Flp pilus assembly pilin Flp
MSERRMGKGQCARLKELLQGGFSDNKGQGTTEYAILVGVLVVIAILAIVAFRGRVQELWDAVSEGINSL